MFVLESFLYLDHLTYFLHYTYLYLSSLEIGFVAIIRPMEFPSCMI